MLRVKYKYFNRNGQKYDFAKELEADEIVDEGMPNKAAAQEIINRLMARRDILVNDIVTVQLIVGDVELEKKESGEITITSYPSMAGVRSSAPAAAPASPGEVRSESEAQPAKPRASGKGAKRVNPIDSFIAGLPPEISIQKVNITTYYEPVDSHIIKLRSENMWSREGKDLKNGLTPGKEYKVEAVARAADQPAQNFVLKNDSGRYIIISRFLFNEAPPQIDLGDYDRLDIDKTNVRGPKLDYGNVVQDGASGMPLDQFMKSING